MHQYKHIYSTRMPVRPAAGCSMELDTTESERRRLTRKRKRFHQPSEDTADEETDGPEGSAGTLNAHLLTSRLAVGHGVGACRDIAFLDTVLAFLQTPGIAFDLRAPLLDLSTHRRLHPLGALIEYWQRATRVFDPVATGKRASKADEKAAEDAAHAKHRQLYATENQRMLQILAELMRHPGSLDMVHSPIYTYSIRFGVQWQSPFAAAVALQDTALADALISMGVRPARSIGCLHSAVAMLNRDGLARWILSHGGPPSHDTSWGGKSALHMAMDRSAPTGTTTDLVLCMLFQPPHVFELDAVDKWKTTTFWRTLDSDTNRDVVDCALTAAVQRERAYRHAIPRLVLSTTRLPLVLVSLICDYVYRSHVP